MGCQPLISRTDSTSTPKVESSILKVTICCRSADCDAGVPCMS